MKKLILGLSLLFSLGLFSCLDGDDDGSGSNAPLSIAEIVIAADDFTLLEQALVRADLVGVFQGTDAYTVFAPNDETFGLFLSENGFASIDDVPVELLQNILRNHVLEGTVTSSQLQTGYVNTLNVFPGTTENVNMYINTEDPTDILINGAVGFDLTDIVASNGIIHIVDTVIPLPSVATFAVADPTFSLLVDALSVDGLMTDFETVLTTTEAPAPLTVLAPTNDAFGSLLMELDFASLQDLVGGIGTDGLDEVLRYHVITDANVRSTDLADGPVTMLSGEDITVDVSGPSVTDVSDRSSNIIVTDVQAWNGVIHAIDTVLLPTLDD